MKKDTLAKIKVGVSELVASSEKIASEYIDQDVNWCIPEGNEEESSYSSATSAVRDNIDQQLRLAIGLLGPVLEIGGYLATKPRVKNTKLEVWCEYDRTGNRHLSDGRPRYPYALEWSQEMKDAYKQYSNLSETLHKLHHQRLKTEKRIAENKASSLWDSV